jgi:hypothetical protein
VALYDVMHVGRVKRHVPRPLSKATGRIDRPNPFIQSLALCLVLGAVRTLDFQSQSPAIRQPDDEIWDVTAARSLPEVVYLEAQMVIFSPSYDTSNSIAI